LKEKFPKKCTVLFEPDLKMAVDYGISELISVVSVAPTPPADSQKRQKVEIELLKK
jgi:hypothetical protein